MLPADGVLRAAQRWLRLFERSTFEQAVALVRSDPAYTDLSQTQYASALEWLRVVDLIVEAEHGPVLADVAQRLGIAGVNRLLFARALEHAGPPWLPDADMLVPDADELPADATDLAELLQLTPNEALLTVRQVHGHIDLAERARVGAAGELALIRTLETRWPGSARHVSLDDDGLGYDIEFTCEGTVWHLEVKSTTRRGRLTIHLSRHEHEVAELDPHWRLVVLGLDTDLQASVIATVASELVLARCPRDSSPAAKWESARHDLSPTDLRVGLPFLSSLPSRPLGEDPTSFAWMPRDDAL